MNRSKWQAPAVLAVVFALSVAGLGAGCGLSDDASETKEASADVVDDQTADDGGGTSTSSSTTPDDGASGTEDGGSGSIDVSGAEFPRTVTYAGFEVTVEDAEVGRDELEGPGVVLSLTVRNLFGEIGKFVPESIGLVDADGARIQAIGFEDPDDPALGYVTKFEMEVAPNGKTQRKAFLPVDGAFELAEATFSVAEEKKLPAEVPLTGEVPESGLPLPITVPTEPVEMYDLGSFTLTLKSAELIEEYGRYRAPEGSHLVAVKLRLEATNGNAYANGNTLRLVVDGTPFGAVLQDPETGPHGIITGGADDMVEIYELPDDYTEVSMLAVSGGGGPADHPLTITVPPLPG
jgi:hypothetical protein